MMITPWKRWVLLCGDSLSLFFCVKKCFIVVPCHRHIIVIVLSTGFHANTDIHYMTKSMWTPARRTFHSKIMGINMELVPSLYCSSGKTFHENMLEHCCRDLIPFSHKRISEVGHWCWAIRSGSQSAFQFILKVFDGVDVRALCGPVKFFHTDLDSPFLYGPHFVHRGIVMLKQERAFPKLLPRSWKHRIV